MPGKWQITLVPVLMTCSLSLQAGAAQPPSVEEIIKDLGYTDAQIDALEQGKIVAIDLERVRGDQLIAAVAARFNASIATLADSVEKGENIEDDTGVLGFGAIPNPEAGYAFEDVTFDASESGEIEKLLAVKPGDTFNLSSEEIAALQNTFKGVKAKDSNAAETVSAAYRAVLKDRLDAYVKEGLAGIAPYDHGGKSFAPAEQLQAVYEDAEPFLTEFFPTFKQALGKFPKDQPGKVSSKFYWIKREVEGRPAIILIHQMLQSSDDFLLMSLREYYVAHTYDSQQVIALGLPVEGGTAVFYVNTAFTDKITGFFSGMAQSIGQGRMRESLEAYFQAGIDYYKQ